MSIIKFEKLDYSSFHSMCNDLVKAEHEGCICPEGAGGDEGIDCYVGAINDKGNLHVFQHKYLLNSLGDSGKRQIRESLGQVTTKHNNLSQWTLLIPKNLTIDEIKWFNTTLSGKFPSISFEFWDSVKLRQLLTKHYRICYDYFELPAYVETQISNHKKDLDNKIIIPMIEAIKQNEKDNLESVMSEFLYQDLTTNHERDFDVKLRSLLECYQNIDDKIAEIRYKLSKELIKKLELFGIKYKENRITSFIENSIPIHDFIERLWKLIKARAYDDSTFWLDEGDPESKRIGFTDEPSSIIYECIPTQDCEKIRNNLVSICNSLIEYIKKDIQIYEELIEGCNKKSKNLKIELESFLYYQRLRFVNMDKMSCVSVIT